MPIAFGQEETLGAQKITLTADNTAYQEGDVITITGKIYNIDFDFLGQPFIALEGDGLFSEVKCIIKDTSQLAGLSADDNVTVVGERLRNTLTEELSYLNPHAVR